MIVLLLLMCRYAKQSQSSHFDANEPKWKPSLLLLVQNEMVCAAAVLHVHHQEMNTLKREQKHSLSAVVFNQVM